jgi:hypothetical protein
MASNDIRKFNFYQQYVWQAADFTNFQLWIRGIIRGIAEGAFSRGVLSGLKVTVAGGLNLSVEAGIAVNEDGRQIFSTTQLSTSVAADGSNPRRSLVVLRPKDTNMTNITEPTNPPNQVPLHVKEEFDLIIIPGTPGVSPQYPSINAGDVIIAGIQIATSAVALTQDNVDYSVAHLAKPRRQRVRRVAADYSVQIDDEIIEASATGGNLVIQFPAAQTMPGQKGCGVEGR